MAWVRGRKREPSPADTTARKRDGPALRSLPRRPRRYRFVAQETRLVLV